MTCVCDEARAIRRASAGSRSGWRLVSGSLSTSSAGGRGDSRGRDPEQVPQRAVRQFGAAQRAQQASLLHVDPEPSRSGRDRDRGAGEGVGDGGVEGLNVSDLENGLDRGGDIGAVVAEHRRARADLGMACRRVGVGAEVIVEAPAAHGLAQHQHLGRRPRVGRVRHRAVEGGEVVGRHVPVAVLASRAHDGTAAVDQQRRGAHRRAAPDALALDLRIVRERRTRGDRQPEVDGVAEIVAGEAEAQAHGVLPRRALHGTFARHDRAAERLGAGPERGFEATVAGE